MSMYESAEKINQDLEQLFNSINLSEFTTRQRETILDIIIRFGSVAKFRCRSNVAYDNFTTACFKNIAKVERVPIKLNDEFKVLRASMQPLDKYLTWLKTENLEDNKESFIDFNNIFYPQKKVI